MIMISKNIIPIERETEIVENPYVLIADTHKKEKAQVMNRPPSSFFIAAINS
jgi:hypothetical protein